MMSFNQRPEHQNLSEQTSNSQTPGNGMSNNGQPVTDPSNFNSNRSQRCVSHRTPRSPMLDSSNLKEVDQTIPGDVNDNLTQGPLLAGPSILIQAHHDSGYQGSSIQNSNTQTPTTRQPPTLPSIAATCGVPSHPDPFDFGQHYTSNDNNIQASRNRAQAHVNGGRWIPRNNNNAAAPPNWAQRPSNPFGHNPNYPWNNDNAPAPPNPHPVVASSTGHPTAAGYLPSTFTSGRVSARNQELMNGSTPLEVSRQRSRMPNPLDAVGEYRPAYRHGLIKRLKDSTARRQPRLSNAQSEDADISQRRSTSSSGTIVVTEQTSRSETIASLAMATLNGTLPPCIVSAPAHSQTNEESDSPVATETPGSDDEAEYYDSSVSGDAKEQDPRADTEAVESAEELTNGSDPEGESAAVTQAIVPPPSCLPDRGKPATDTASDAP